MAKTKTNAKKATGGKSVRKVLGDVATDEELSDGREDRMVLSEDDEQPADKRKAVRKRAVSASIPRI